MIFCIVHLFQFESVLKPSQHTHKHIHVRADDLITNRQPHACQTTAPKGEVTDGGFREGKGRTTQEELVLGWDGAQLADELAVEVLQAVPLVHNDVLPLIALQVLHVSDDDLVGCDHHREVHCHGLACNPNHPHVVVNQMLPHE